MEAPLRGLRAVDGADGREAVGSAQGHAGAVVVSAQVSRSTLSAVSLKTVGAMAYVRVVLALAYGIFSLHQLVSGDRDE